MWLLFALPAASQARLEDKYTVFRFNLEDGLPCNYVDDVLKDHYGFLWIITSGGGVCRYDGSELLVFDKSSKTPIKNNFARNAVEDKFGRLWIGSEGGLDIINLEDLTAAQIQLPDFCREGSTLCSYVTLDSLGNIWTKFQNTIYCILFDRDGGISDTLSFTHPALSPENVVFKDVDGDGSVWVSLYGRLNKIIKGTEGSLEARPIAGTPVFGESSYVSDFLCVGPRVWISTEYGLYQLYRTTGEWKFYSSMADNPRSLTQNFVTSLALTQDGQLLASTLHGINAYNPISDDFDRIGTSVVNCIKTDIESICVATENQGLVILSPKRLSIRDYVHRAEDPLSLAPGAVNAVWEDAEGRLWVGTVEGGLSIRESGSDYFSHLTREKDGLAHNSVSAIRPGPGNIMYIGTWGAGIDVLSATPPYKVLAHLPAGGSLTEYIGMLEYDVRNNVLWIGSNHGIFVYDIQSCECFPAVDESADGCIGSYMDVDGRLWVGGLRGAFVFDLNSRGEDGRFQYWHLLPDEKISCIAGAPDGSIYLGSTGSGLYKAVADSDSGFVTSVTSWADGLSNNSVRGICVDEGGHVWVSTEHGLNRIDPRSGMLESFFVRDGLYSDRFHWNDACHGRDGILYFGHAEGLSELDPSRFSEASLSRPLMFTCVSVDGTEYRNPSLGELSLHERNSSVQFSFSSLGAGPRVRYQYRLDGLEKNWQTLPEGAGSVTYSSLGGGKYVFRVRALDSYRVVSGTLALPVLVRPYFYHTWWFYILVILIIVLTGWTVIIWRTRYLKRRQEVLEALVDERTREIQAQKKLVEHNAEELRRQNQILTLKNEELASRKLLFAPERRSETERKDDIFREKVLDSLRRLYKDPGLDVNMFCRAMATSKTLLNNKLQESFGQSIGQLIRTYRLAVAREMLESGTTLTVSEIAYEVGFNDPKYFTRCFTKEFNEAPSSVQKST